MGYQNIFKSLKSNTISVDNILKEKLVSYYNIMEKISV